MKQHKTRIKLANVILLALIEIKKAKLKDIQLKLEDIGHRSSEAVKDSHRFAISLGRDWHSAAQQVLDKVSRDMNDFSYHLSRFKEFVGRDTISIPLLSDIVSELLQMEQEFEQFRFDLAGKTISVITKPIVLENITFGAFEIQLHLNDFNKLYQNRPYRVIALNPNPAATDEDVTHPHVSHEILCEGDGHTAISKALEQGRICDFFTMVIGVLENYNSASPYVSIDDWEGRSCYDCGRTMSSDDSYYCDSCDNDFCDHCSTYCQKCDTTVCLGCSYECPACGQPVCSRCTAKCKDCEEVFCKDCLTDGLCQSCQEQRKEEDEYGEEQESESIPSIQSDRVG